MIPAPISADYDTLVDAANELTEDECPHSLCDACEWVHLCTKRQTCVPVTKEEKK